MRNIVRTYVERFKHEKQTRRRFTGIVAVLALVVVFGVFWQLHYTGVAMANETFCGEEEHQHDESCYERQLVCGEEETEEHTHDDSCYEEVLVCDKEEHTHTVACLVDETADVETAADWEATLPILSGNQSDDVVAVAQSQIGYTESESNFQLSEDEETRQGYTRYGAWYGTGETVYSWTRNNHVTSENNSDQSTIDALASGSYRVEIAFEDIRSDGDLQIGESYVLALDWPTGEGISVTPGATSGTITTNGTDLATWQLDPNTGEITITILALTDDTSFYLYFTATVENENEPEPDGDVIHIEI